MTATRTKPQQKRLGSCDLKAVSWAKCGENLADTACGTLKRAAFVADPDLPLGSTRENRQTQCNSKLLGKYRFNRCAVPIPVCWEGGGVRSHRD
jgi:hypothetical protein